MIVVLDLLFLLLLISTLHNSKRLVAFITLSLDLNNILFRTISNSTLSVQFQLASTVTSYQRHPRMDISELISYM